MCFMREIWPADRILLAFSLSSSAAANCVAFLRNGLLVNLACRLSCALNGRPVELIFTNNSMIWLSSPFTKTTWQIPIDLLLLPVLGQRRPSAEAVPFNDIHEVEERLKPLLSIYDVKMKIAADQSLVNGECRDRKISQHGLDQFAPVTFPPNRSPLKIWVEMELPGPIQIDHVLDFPRCLGIAEVFD
jgi:hypothetical protein